jgi:transcriptional regulator with XRE-family HTH domain
MLAERICLLRRAKGWSQAELARQLQISPSAVGMYEQGRREPSLSAVVALSRTFGVSVDYLLTGTALTGRDAVAMKQAVQQCLPGTSRGGGLSREEVAVLFEAAMTET